MGLQLFRSLIILTFDKGVASSMSFHCCWLLYSLRLMEHTFMTSKQKQVGVLKLVTYLRMLLFLNNGYSFLRMIGVIKLVVFCWHHKYLHIWTLIGNSGAKNLSFIKHWLLKTFSDWHQLFWLQLLSTPIFLFPSSPPPSLSERRTLWVAPLCNSIL